MSRSRHDQNHLARLVRRARKGDRKAEAELLQTLEPAIRGYFIRRVGRHPELDDLVQNTLLRVFRGLPDLKDGARIRGFAMKAALFELQDLFRGRYGSRETVFAVDMIEPSAAPDDAGTAIDIDRALAELTPKARRIIELKVLGFKYEEIAREVDTTEAAVKMQVKRALERLHERLGVLVFFAGGSSLLLLFERLLRL